MVSAPRFGRHVLYGAFIAAEAIRTRTLAISLRSLSIPRSRRPIHFNPEYFGSEYYCPRCSRFAQHVRPERVCTLTGNTLGSRASYIAAVIPPGRESSPSSDMPGTLGNVYGVGQDDRPPLIKPAA